ncbi:MAG TPA: SIMPL domain-containing protein [candidate division Zixibacteria bacterium]|nr:SIMPL domain-containing protein [candidate division Zixibacteria bacterium]
MGTGSTSVIRSTGLITASAVISLSLIICAVIGARTIIQVKTQGQSISVTGAAFKPIRSNFAVWSAEIVVRDTTLVTASAALKRSVAAAQRFLNQQGFDSTQYEFNPIHINKLFDRKTQDIIGYQLSRSVSIELADVDRIARLADQAGQLIEQGVELNSSRPRYLFTELDNLKLEMIQEATRNAYERAAQIAAATGAAVGAPVSAGVGVFQIRPLHSQEVSSYGISDVTSIEKEIVSTVHMQFLID